MSDHLILVGAGPMAIDYAKVLQAQNISFEVIGRGPASAAIFKEKTGVAVREGGLDDFIRNTVKAPRRAIVSVGVEMLSSVTISLLKWGVKELLVEKPGGLAAADIKAVRDEAKRQKADVFIAYNRRFYSSVMKALEIIRADGGVTSFHFEFTEWSHEIVNLPKPKQVKENWLLANSTHVIDLAFFLGGEPREISCYSAGGISWHPSASIFAGAGISKTGAPFSYHANWEAPGRWSVEIMTKNHRLIFRPMEQLQVQKIGSVAIETVEIPAEIDKKYKPGLYLQVEAFMHDDRERLLSLDEHVIMLKYYDLINKKHIANNR